jgi:hypothetical protein
VGASGGAGGGDGEGSCCSAARRLTARLLGLRWSSAEVLDDLNQLVRPISVAAGEVDQLLRSLDDSPAFGCSRNGDATSTTELQQSLVSEQPQRAEHGVGVDAEDGGEVFRGRKAFTGLRLSLRNSAAELGGDLLVQVGRSRLSICRNMMLVTLA